MDKGMKALLVGVLMVIMGAISFWMQLSKKRKCTAVMDAEIVDVKRIVHRSNGRRRGADYSPVLHYEVSGLEYTGLADEVSSILPNKFQEGQKMTIKYDPSNPEIFCVKGKIGNIKWGIMFMVLGIAIMLVYFL